jgi:hypothetical protein
MPFTLHPLLARSLRCHGLKRFFNSLSESTRNEFDRFIRSVKKKKPASAGSIRPSNT